MNIKNENENIKDSEFSSQQIILILNFENFRLLLQNVVLI
jgi:hypothetical protein